RRSRRPHARPAVRASRPAPAARRRRSLRARDTHLDAEGSMLFVDANEPVGAVLSRHTLLQQIEPEARPRAPRSIGIAWILERNRHVGFESRRGNMDRAAIEQLTNAVDDSILDERLQQE